METKKPYSWEEIKAVLIENLKKTKHILTFGTIGSCNINHDIDLIITKKPFSKSSSFYKEIHQLYDTIDSYLRKKYNCRLIKFVRSDEQFSIENMSKNPQDLFFHSMTYLNWNQLEKDWRYVMFPDENLKEFLINSYNCLFGGIWDLFEKNFQTQSYNDCLYLYISFYDKIHSNFPEKLFLRTMNHYFDYLCRKRLKIRSIHSKNIREIRKNFYKLCDILDRKSIQKPLIKNKSLILQINLMTKNYPPSI